MVSDNELLDEVRAVLNTEVADVTAPSTLLAAVHREHARRRTFRRWTWIAVPLVAAAAAAVVVLPAKDSRPPDVQPINVAHVLEGVRTAVDGVAGNIIYERGEAPPGDKYFEPGDHGVNERWHAADGSTFRFRASVDGTPLVDLSRDVTADIFVDYRKHTYRNGPGVTLDQDDVWTPERIQQAIKDGRITVEGPSEPIRDTPTVRLIIAAKVGAPTEMWVDANTYLPMRWHWMQDRSSTMDVTWLPPTPENLDQLKTSIPEGFTEVR